HVAAIEKEPRGAILGEIAGPEIGGELAEAALAPEIELPQPVAPGVEALHEEHVAAGRGVDVGNPPAIDDDLGGPFEARHLQVEVAGDGIRHGSDTRLCCGSPRTKYRGMSATSKLPSPQTMDWPRSTIFTVGHSTLPIEDFVALLQAYRIECLADIRTVPRSRHNPQFNGEELGKSLAAHQIQYVAMPALGGLRHPRKDSPNAGWRNKGFRGYADYMQTEPFAEGLDALLALSREKRTAIMCA